MGLNSEQAYKEMVDLISKVKNVGGVFTLIWHNNLFYGEKGEFFKSVITYLNNQDVWFTTGSELIDWYESQNYFEEINAHLIKLRSKH